ncbi:MAG: DHH family phosphoesterase [Thaumarchaeota archaeon]|nr:DHH family phosphoesterase [Nitrososphaerota archaeon]
MEVRHGDSAARVSRDLTGDLQGLLRKTEKVGQSLRKASRSRANILVVAPYTADGALCAGIVTEAVLRKEGRFVVRGIDEAGPDALDALQKENFDLYVFCGVNCDSKQLNEIFKAKWLSFQDNSMPVSASSYEQVLNPWEFGFQGGGETSASGMAYLMVKSIDESLISLAWMPVVACLSDGLDGASRRLSGLGKMFVNDALESHSLALSEGLILYGAESKPLHLALASTTRPFIPILVGNREGCFATLNSTDVKLKNDSAWKNLKDFSPEEVETVTGALQPLIATQSSSLAVNKVIVGEVYVLQREERGSALRDAREYGDLLQACACSGRIAEAVSVSLGEWGSMLADIERVLADHRGRLRTVVQDVVKAEPEAVEGVLFAGGLDVNERFLMALVDATAAVPKFYGNIVLLGSVPKEGKVRICARASLDMGLSDARVGEIARQAADQVDAQGGGNASGGWAVIAESKAQSFVKEFRKGLKREHEDKGGS